MRIMEQFIISTPEQLEAFFIRAIQKISSLQPAKIELPENIGSEEARKLLAEIWGLSEPVSYSWFSKENMKGNLPSGKVGKRLIFNRAELIEYAQSKVVRPLDTVSEAITKAARRRRVNG